MAKIDELSLQFRQIFEDNNSIFSNLTFRKGQDELPVTLTKKLGDCVTYSLKFGDYTAKTNILLIDVQGDIEVILSRKEGEKEEYSIVAAYPKSKVDRFWALSFIGSKYIDSDSEVFETTAAVRGVRDSEIDSALKVLTKGPFNYFMGEMNQTSAQMLSCMSDFFSVSCYDTLEGPRLKQTYYLFGEQGNTLFTVAYNSSANSAVLLTGSRDILPYDFMNFRTFSQSMGLFFKNY